MTTTPEPPERPEPSTPDQGGDAGGVSAEQAVLDAAGDAVEDAVEGVLAAEDVEAMERLDSPRRLLLVHAHPDDETIATGATMAAYAAAGASVTLVTCTRGELGEVIPDDLRHLEGTDALADHRVQELANAMEALGVEDHRFLGDDATDADGVPAPVRFHDSGMVWTADGAAGPQPDVDPRAFALVDVDGAAGHLVRVLRETRPQVVVTYDPGGGYGHPDHVQAHRVAMRAVELARDPAHDGGEPWEVAKVYWSVVPQSEAADLPGRTSAVVPDSEVTAEIEASAQREAKSAALRAHATQVVVDGGDLLLSNGRRQPVRLTEHYHLAVGQARPGADGRRETDLFAGLA